MRVCMNVGHSQPALRMYMYDVFVQLLATYLDVEKLVVLLIFSILVAAYDINIRYRWWLQYSLLTGHVSLSYVNAFADGDSASHAPRILNLARMRKNNSYSNYPRIIVFYTVTIEMFCGRSGSRDPNLPIWGLGISAPVPAGSQTHRVRRSPSRARALSEGRMNCEDTCSERGRARVDYVLQRVALGCL